jgi:hypothetical protein
MLFQMILRWLYFKDSVKKSVLVKIKLLKIANAKTDVSISIRIY